MTHPYLVHILDYCIQNIPGHFHLKMFCGVFCFRFCFAFFLSLGNFKNTQPRFSLPLLDLCIFEPQASGSRCLEEQALQESKTPGVLLEEQAVMMTASPLLYEAVDTEGLFLHPHD